MLFLEEQSFQSFSNLQSINIIELLILGGVRGQVGGSICPIITSSNPRTYLIVYLNNSFQVCTLQVIVLTHELRTLSGMVMPHVQFRKCNC